MASSFFQFSLSLLFTVFLSPQTSSIRPHRRHASVTKLTKFKTAAIGFIHPGCFLVDFLRVTIYLIIVDAEDAEFKLIRNREDRLREPSPLRHQVQRWHQKKGAKRSIGFKKVFSPSKGWNSFILLIKQLLFFSQK